MTRTHPDTSSLAVAVRDALTTLLRELLEGPAENGFVLNPGDRGLLVSLEQLSAGEASAQPGGRASVAAHVEHLRYGFELRNRWAQGDDPWSTANWSASWTRQQVTDDQWRSLRHALAEEARRWLQTSGEPREWTATDLTEVMASTVHLAYHLGAIRQIAQAAGGPPASD